MGHASLAEYLAEFDGRGAEVAYIQRRGYRTVRVSYWEVAQQARRFARHLEAQQIAKGDRVLIWGEDCAEWVIAFWGCVLRGAIAVPIDRIAAPDFVLRVMQQTDAKLAVGSGEALHSDPNVPVLTFDKLLEIISVY